MYRLEKKGTQNCPPWDTLIELNLIGFEMIHYDFL